MKWIITIIFLGTFQLYAYPQDINVECELVYKKAVELFKSSNYQLALKKITAYKLCCKLNQQKKADSLLLKIYETVNQQRLNAEDNAKKAKQQEEIALRERDKTQGNYLISEAKSIVESDPTLALRLAEEAMKRNTDSSIIKTALKIYRENSFYQLPFDDLGYNCINFSNDGNLIFLGGKYGISYLINLKTGYINPYLHEENSVLKSSISYDNKYILTLNMTSSLSGSLIYSLKCWNVNNDTITICNLKNEINQFAFSPINHTFLVSTNDSTFNLFDLEGRILQEFKGHNGKVTSIAFSPNGKYIVSGSTDWTTRLWNLQGICLHTYKKHNKYISSVAFSPDGKSILSGSWDNTAKLIDTSGYLVREFKGHSDFVTSVSFSHNGNFILTGSVDNTAKLWNIYGLLLQEFKGHTKRIESALFYPNDKSILTTSRDGTVRSWGIKNESIVNSEESEIISSFEVSFKNNFILTTSSDNICRLKNANGNILMRFVGHKGNVTTCDFSQNEKFIITGSYDSTAILWNIDGSIKRIFSGYNNRIQKVKFSPNGNSILLFQSLADSVEVWDIEGNLNGKFFGIPPLCFSPDGKHLNTSNPSNKTYENYFTYDLNVKTFRSLYHPEPISEMLYFPNGKLILTSFSDTIRILDLKGKVLQKFNYKNYSFYSIDISSDSKNILAIGNNKDGESLIIWDLSGNVINEFFLGYHYESIVKFSPDNKSVFLKIDGNNELLKWEIPSNLFDFLKSGNLEPLNNKQKHKYNIK